MGLPGNGSMSLFSDHELFLACYDDVELKQMKHDFQFYSGIKYAVVQG
jgi:hypothetical protein